MEFVTARELRLDPKGVWKRIQSQSLGVVTINGKPSFLLSKFKPEELEEMLYIQRRIRAELALKHMRDQAAKRGLDRMTMEEIDEVVREVRKARRTRRHR